MSAVPTFMVAIWAVKIRPITTSGRHSSGAIRNPAQPAGAPGPQRDHQSAHDEAQPGQAQGRRVQQADLDGDGVAAPEEGDEQGQRGPGEVDVADLVAQGRDAGPQRTRRAMSASTIIHSHEDRARRTPQERQDDAVQPPHRLQRGDVALRRRPRRDAHRRGPRARSARRSAERAVQAQEDDVRHVRGGRPRRDREGRAHGARRQGVPQRRRPAARGARVPRRDARGARPAARHPGPGAGAGLRRSRGGRAPGRAPGGVDQEAAQGRRGAGARRPGAAQDVAGGRDAAARAAAHAGRDPPAPRLHVPVAEADPPSRQRGGVGDRRGREGHRALRAGRRRRPARRRGWAGCRR